MRSRCLFLDIKRRRIVFCLKSLTPDMEKIHIATIYHFLKVRCPKLVQDSPLITFVIRSSLSTGYSLFDCFTGGPTVRFDSSCSASPRRLFTEVNIRAENQRFVRVVRPQPIDLAAFVFRLPKTVSLNNKAIRFDLSHDDLYCLNEGQYLNDNIIDFYLQ